jgi:hypothetical protein
VHRSLPILAVVAAAVCLASVLPACGGSSSSQTANRPQPAPYYPQQYPPQQYPPQQQYPQQQYPPTQQQQYPQQQVPPPGKPPPAQQPPVQQPPQGTPLLPPLVGSVALQGEVRAILAELIAALPAATATKVRGIPLVFDPDPNDINAFAGCDEKGAPYLAGTVGLLEAVDAIAQTKATDELFGTQTYDAYLRAVLPRLTQAKGGSAALPMGTIPPQYLLDPRRLSHAHELFDDVVAFTFGHELGHHYLNHTGCANGQPMGNGPNPAVLGQLVVRVIPGLNQFNEAAADNAGCINELDAGRARRPNYRWSEKGGLLLLDFFSALERAAGVSVFNPIGFLRTHPNPQIRIPFVQATARTWYAQHPG